MSKFTFFIVVMAVVAMAAARPQGVSVVDNNNQVKVVDSDSQVTVVDSNGPGANSGGQVNVVDSESQVSVVN